VSLSSKLLTPSSPGCWIVQLLLVALPGVRCRSHVLIFPELVLLDLQDAKKDVKRNL
jgi:hypothetical protein